jgi:membrane fusion protein, adhesin transport system
VNIESHFPGEHRRELLLKSGMSLDADIITGQKTIMEYLLKPIYASTREAMQER